MELAHVAIIIGLLLRYSYKFCDVIWKGEKFSSQNNMNRNVFEQLLHGFASEHTDNESKTSLLWCHFFAKVGHFCKVETKNDHRLSVANAPIYGHGSRYRSQKYFGLWDSFTKNGHFMKVSLINANFISSNAHAHSHTVYLASYFGF